MEGFFYYYLSLYRPIITKLNELLRHYDLSYSLWQIIFYINKNGSSTLVDIANHYNVEKPTITRRVHRLLEQEMVKQLPSKDRREKIIQLTDLGEEIYQKCRVEITNLENSMMKDISKDEQEIIFHTLFNIQNMIINKEGNEVE